MRCGVVDWMVWSFAKMEEDRMDKIFCISEVNVQNRKGTDDQ